MEQFLAGKVALVTGSSRGLGRQIINHFQASGARGLGIDQIPDDGRSGEGWIYHQADVSDENGMSKAMDIIDQHFGQLDIVVANAGLVPPWSKIEELEMSEWDHVFAVNVRGVVITMKHAVPQMKKNGGSIILMGSINSGRGHAGQTLYSATKHAVLGIVRSSALDLGSHGIRVNAIGPGPIATEALKTRITARSKQGGLPVQAALAEFGSQTALGRIATEEEVASTAVFLASDLSAGISGQIIVVDAGLA